jgi:hypothetical protein
VRASLPICVVAILGCRPAPGGAGAPGAPEQPASAAGDALAVHDELEARIASGGGGASERQAALRRVEALADDGSAGYAFARAAVAGRVAEERGVKAGAMVTAAEDWARRSRERDPAFRDGAASRLLGTLWVLAPRRLLRHGDSEDGLELLESLVRDHPDDPRARLRLAEAFIALGDPDPALEHLCAARAGVSALPADEQGLLGRLIEDAGGEPILASCPAAGR